MIPITRIEDLGTVVTRAAADMKDSPSVSIQEDWMRSRYVVTGEGVEFVAELNTGYVRISYSPLTDDKRHRFEKRILDLRSRSAPEYSANKCSFTTLSAVETVYSAMQALFRAHNEANAPAQRDPLDKVFDDANKGKDVLDGIF